jgi:hypothetical protein
MKKIYTFSFLFLFLSNALLAQSIIGFEDANLPLDTTLNNASPNAAFQSGDALFPNFFNPDFGGFWESGWAISTMRDDSTSGFSNLTSAITGAGYESDTYVIGQQNATIKLSGNAIGKVVNGIYITNTTYAHNSMRDGDSFAKKFGGLTGNDPDFFKLTIQKFSNDSLQTDTVVVYLADFRFEDNTQDFILKDWQWVDLSSLGNVDSLLFTLSSSDVGSFGINTPLFFAMDHLEISDQISTSTADLNQAKWKIKLYPNPAIDYIQIVTTHNNLNATARIYSPNGQLVLEKKITHSNQQLNIANFEKGLYFLNIINENGVQLSRSFLKQ